MKPGWYAASGQLVRFGLVGIMNTLVTLATIFILMEVAGLNYLLSNVCGYALGLVNSFIWNKLWTFKSSRPMLKEGAAFLVVFAVCYLVQSGALALMVERLHTPKLLAQVLAMVVYTGLNFAGNKLISFRPERKSGFTASDGHQGDFR